MARLKYKYLQPKIIETYFGQITVDPDKIINFPKTILGFPQYHDYCICNIPENKVPGSLIMQSAEEDRHAFIITPLGNEIFEASDPVMEYQDLVDVASTYNIKQENLFSLAITKLSKENDKIIKTLNLMAPILIDIHEKLGYQHVFLKNNYPINYIVG
ncbi:MAG: flagellar assembly protein FliW [Rickettsiaceae bacterium]|nr:flagellar assembly protein FliW [Rickettsiaceae bacterium]